MTLSSTPSLLDQTLSAVARRYRLPALPVAAPGMQRTDPAIALAIAIEQARMKVAGGVAPDAASRQLFVEALASLIHDAMRAQRGDPVFQAMVLRHRAPHVREHASLSTHADQDRRAVRAAVNAIAHPAKQQRMPPSPQSEALAQLHAATASASWPALADCARRIAAMPDLPRESPLERSLVQLLDSPALARLMRLHDLASDELVQRYQSLWDRQGPRPGSPEAAAQGSAARRRGAEVERLTALALEALAHGLDRDTGVPHRVVTSMRVPAAIPGSAERAKTEWDAVLLRQAFIADAAPVWDVCLLAEAKASVDAAATDLPRLLRGMRLLAHADEHAVYPFESQQGTVRLNGASLRALTIDEASLAASVLYCCDAPAEATPRLLAATGRMQLLSAQASLEFASRLAAGQQADAQDLEPVWRQLLESPRWASVLEQYQTLRLGRELMVHTQDLLTAIDISQRGRSCPNPPDAARCARE